MTDEAAAEALGAQAVAALHAAGARDYLGGVTATAWHCACS